tara:strand:+ start:119 stop:403 length:285 start_codon:yes stop_codon:yes gene_type:complete
MYYNTNDETGETLQRSRNTSTKQEDLILAVFETYPNEGLTPFDIEDFAHDQEVSWPITSIRRAITDLTNAGKLTKTNTKKLGRYGKLVHTWKLS